MTTVLFGNTSPMMTEKRLVERDGIQVEQVVQVPAKHISKSVTRIELWDGVSDPEFVSLATSTDNDRMLSMIARGLPGGSQAHAVSIRELEDVVAVHANGAKPIWIVSDDSALQAAAAAHFGCQQGEPTALLTNAGRDAVHAQIYSGTQPAPFVYGALTANTGSGFAVTDTTLAGEIATAGGGLIRGTMTYAHTAGTNTSTLTKTWVANGSDSLPVTVASMGTFNASSGGTLGNEDTLNSTAQFNVVGDSATVTFTQTAG